MQFFQARALFFFIIRWIFIFGINATNENEPNNESTTLNFFNEEISSSIPKTHIHEKLISTVIPLPQEELESMFLKKTVWVGLKPYIKSERVNSLSQLCSSLWKQARRVGPLRRCTPHSRLHKYSHYFAILNTKQGRPIEADFLECKCYHQNAPRARKLDNSAFFVSKFDDSRYFILDKPDWSLNELHITEMREISDKNPTGNTSVPPSY